MVATEANADTNCPQQQPSGIFVILFLFASNVRASRRGNKRRVVDVFAPALWASRAKSLRLFYCSVSHSAERPSFISLGARRLQGDVNKRKTPVGRCVVFPHQFPCNFYDKQPGRRRAEIYEQIVFVKDESTHRSVADVAHSAFEERRLADHDGHVARRDVVKVGSLHHSRQLRVAAAGLEQRVAVRCQGTCNTIKAKLPTSSRRSLARPKGCVKTELLRERFCKRGICNC
jgi:hypothetical protein